MEPDAQVWMHATGTAPNNMSEIINIFQPVLVKRKEYEAHLAQREIHLFSDKTY